MEGRRNTLTAFEDPKFCYNLRTNQGCDAYYSHTSGQGKMRLCYNPIEPNINNDVFCAATTSYVVCDFAPPSPPAPPAPPRPPIQPLSIR